MTTQFIDQFYVNISRQGEFSSFLREAADAEIALLSAQLKAAAQSLGDTKSTTAELVQDRLSQVRKALVV